jgi:hypothetical protein
VPQARISTCFVRAKMSSASAPNSPADNDELLVTISSVLAMAPGCSKISFCM